MTRALLASLFILAIGAPTHASEPEDRAPQSAPSAPEVDTAHTDAGDEETTSPFSASVLGEVSVGAGTFTPGPAARPYVNLLTKVRGSYRFDDIGLSLGLSFSVNVNAVENADSGNAVAHQVKPGDLRLTAALDGLLTWDTIGLEVLPTVALSLPTSLESLHVGKLFGLSAGLSVAVEPLDWLYTEVRTSFTKNVNLTTHAVLDAGNFDLAPLSRAGGAEAIAEGRVATAGGLTSWYAVWGAGVTFTPVDDFSILIDFEMLHLFSYDAIALDEYSSPYAHEGRGQSDLMYGTVEFGYEVLDGLSLALGTMVEQEPLSADNTSPRFPWWDTTNGSANRQVFYVDVIGSF
jgi:hypothetical protein